MSVTEFKRAMSRCDFLLDWQKDRLMGMLDGAEDDDGCDDNGHIRAKDVFLVLDHVLWRMMGVSLDSLSVRDRLGIEQAVREVAC